MKRVQFRFDGNRDFDSAVKFYDVKLFQRKGCHAIIHVVRKRYDGFYMIDDSKIRISASTIQELYKKFLNETPPFFPVKDIFQLTGERFDD